MAAYTVWAGESLRLYTSQAFTSISGVIVNPDVVILKWAIQGQTTTFYTWTNPSGDPSGHIVNTGTGLFRADLPTTGLDGVWTVQWNGQPGISGLDVTKTSAIFEYTVTVSPTAL